MGKHSVPRDPFSAKRLAFLSATAVVTAVVANNHRPWHENHSAPPSTLGLPTTREYLDPTLPPPNPPGTIVPLPADEGPADDYTPPGNRSGPFERRDEPSPPRRNPRPEPGPNTVPAHDVAMTRDMDAMSHGVTASISQAMDARDALTHAVHPTAAPAPDPNRERDLADIATAITRAMTDLAIALQSAAAAVEPR
ncbi:hypothetical protein [Nocardia pseudobrasiliensis]|uniref:Uncharacterized protein n=1 Tax=Nocardia pseudobrasiliensis TaxID=45979 RepID=A0A370I8R2_9NOCA|nr:hypothetical protein [Nocardia pseudobrasiliensis]RDI67000.1 hypothetical protein DFR76_10371 [Nocardia pseudobrasiliensis]